MTDLDDTFRTEHNSTPSRNADWHFSAGQLLCGKYKVLGLIGKGGNGSVYRVQQVFLNKELALKVVDSRHVFDDVIMRRFQVEAKAAFSLNHSNLVKVIDFGLLENDQPYLAMDLVEGSTLSDYVKENGPMSVEMATAVFEQVCNGLAYAHQQSVIHRDIKPSNIMLVDGMDPRQPGGVKIVDFGIAKIAGDEGGEIQALTRTGEIFGSPLYMSPEQCSGATLDERTDIYSLGCTLFEALTGTPPHVGSNALRTMMLHQSETAPSLKEASLGKQFPESIEHIVQKMLRKAPHDRYQNPQLVAQDLVRARTNSLVVSTKPKGINEHRSVPWQPVLGSFAVLTVTVCTIFWFLQPSEKQKAAVAIKSGANPPNPNPNSQISSLTANLANDLSSVEANSQKSINAFATAKPITSELVTVGSKKLRRIKFPDFPMGIVKDAGSPSRFEVDAAKTLDFPADATLGLEIGANHHEAFDHPEIFEKIAPDIFTSVSLSAPSYRLQRMPSSETSKQDQNVAAILKTVSKWTNLTKLGINSLYIPPEALDGIEAMKELQNLQLYEVFDSEHELSKRGVMKRLKSLSLTACSAAELIDAAGDETHTNTRLEQIVLENTGIQPNALERLKYCKNLRYLQFREPHLNNAIVSAIGQIKTLQDIYLKQTTPTPTQVQSILKDCTSLRKLMISRRYATRLEAINFKDPKVVFVD